MGRWLVWATRRQWKWHRWACALENLQLLFHLVGVHPHKTQPPCCRSPHESHGEGRGGDLRHRSQRSSSAPTASHGRGPRHKSRPNLQRPAAHGQCRVGQKHLPAELISPEDHEWQSVVTGVLSPKFCVCSLQSSKVTGRCLPPGENRAAP